MIAILTLVYAQWASVVVVLCDAGGCLGFFARGVDNLLRFAYPTLGWIVY